MNQLLDLLAYLKIKKKVHIVGLSFGGLIAVNFASSYSKKISKIILIDPAGFYLKLPPLLNKLLNAPIADFLFQHFLLKFLPHLAKRDFFNPRNFEMYYEKYNEQMLYDGFNEALLSTIRHMFLENSLPAFEKLDKDETDVLLIWGEHDKTVPYKYHKDLLNIVPQTKFYPVKNAAHMPHCEQAEDVNREIISFLKK